MSTPDDAQLADLYRRAWVFAYPSTYEGFGLPYLEAMASGTAVVATPSAAAGRFLADGLGRIVADADFGSTVGDLLRDLAAREDLETQGRDAVAGYTWPAIARRHRELYEEAIARHPRPGAT